MASVHSGYPKYIYIMFPDHGMKLAKQETVEGWQDDWVTL